MYVVIVRTTVDVRIHIYLLIHWDPCVQGVVRRMNELIGIPVLLCVLSINLCMPSNITMFIKPQHKMRNQCTYFELNQLLVGEFLFFEG